jgi:hypothetical protein
VGYVHSSAYISEEAAEGDLRNYVAQSVGRERAESLPVRKIDFRPGYRHEFWHRNCVAVGLSAGFVEPLEASALALIELSARTIADQLPAHRAAMDVVAARFNETMRYQWQRIMEFLKLHYALSKRTDSEYWRDNTRLDALPGELRALLELWRTQGPYHQDTPRRDSLFPSASYQYVLYGMDYDTDASPYTRRLDAAAAQHAESLFAENEERTRLLLDALPTNRDLLNPVKQSGFQPD